MADSLLSDLELLSRLVAFDTTSSRPSRPLADYVAGYLSEAGVEAHLHAYAAGEKGNLVARAGPDTAGGILLSGHLDVVPATEDDWVSDPFVLSERDNRLYGRGTADMKGFVALAANTLARLAGERLSRPLVLLLTSDEEVGTVGARTFARTWDRRFRLPAEGIVGEPTGLRVVRMHKGHLSLRLTLSGEAAHSGYPHLGRSAIEPAADLLVLLRDLRRELEDERCPESAFFPECPHPVLNVGVVRGGTAINIIPDRCELDVGARLMPGQTTDAFLERLHDLLADCPALPRKRLSVAVLNDSPPLLCPADLPVHAELTRLIGQGDSYGVSFASDAGPLQRMGLDCVLWGPGSIEDAHQANESLSMAQFSRGGELLDRFVRQRCCD